MTKHTPPLVAVCMYLHTQPDPYPFSHHCAIYLPNHQDTNVESKPQFDDGMNDYERERMQQIQRNKNRMSELQLPQAMAELGGLNQQRAGSAPTQRGVSSKRCGSVFHSSDHK